MTKQAGMAAALLLCAHGALAQPAERKDSESNDVASRESQSSRFSTTSRARVRTAWSRSSKVTMPYKRTTSRSGSPR